MCVSSSLHPFRRSRRLPFLFARSTLIVRASVKSLRIRPFLCARVVRRQFPSRDLCAEIGTGSIDREARSAAGSPIDERNFGDRAEPPVAIRYHSVQILRFFLSLESSFVARVRLL